MRLSEGHGGDDVDDGGGDDVDDGGGGDDSASAVSAEPVVSASSSSFGRRVKTQDRRSCLLLKKTSIYMFLKYSSRRVCVSLF